METSGSKDESKYGLRYFDKEEGKNDGEAEGLVDDEGPSSCPKDCCDADCECDDCVRCANYAMAREGEDDDQYESSADAS